MTLEKIKEIKRRCASFLNSKQISKLECIILDVTKELEGQIVSEEKIYDNIGLFNSFLSAKK